MEPKIKELILATPSTQLLITTENQRCKLDKKEKTAVHSRTILLTSLFFISVQTRNEKIISTVILAPKCNDYLDIIISKAYINTMVSTSVNYST